MKQDLTVHPISLKNILENLDKIPEKTGRFGEPSNELSKSEKKQLHEFMRRFNEYGKALRGDQAIMETAKALSQMSDMAKKYAMHENNSDFMQRETVERDFKQLGNITTQFQKLAKECVSRQMQLAALYEDAGNLYERYFEMEAMNEMAGNVPPPETNLSMSEVADECNDVDCDDPNHDHNVADLGGEDDHASSFGTNIQESKKK